ncbi:MAG: hypothetical protein IE909_19110, partial [Campylobacterales bacterium]|nr:hypothetical protein [Campylobacterales bacterium]
MHIEIILNSVNSHKSYLEVRKIESDLINIEDKIEHYNSLDEDEQLIYYDDFRELYVEKRLLEEKLQSYVTNSNLQSQHFNSIYDYDGRKKLIIFSGAGISAESGIATFRSHDGLWNSHDINSICNLHTWENNFDLVHEFYNERREELKYKYPNHAHKVVAELQSKYANDCYVITQNIDDLFERAGCKNVLHLHGELTKLKCLECNNVWEIGYEKFHYGEEYCENCKNTKTIKPNVVFFNEPAPMYNQMYRAFDALKNPQSIIIVVGTSGNVINIGEMLKHYNCIKVLNNLEETKYIDYKQFHNVFFNQATT